MALNPNLGGLLSVCLSQGCWGGVKITPCLKLINIVLEIEVWYISTNTSITYSGKAPLILLKSEFVLQKSPFLGKTKIFWFWCYSKTEVICDTTLYENLPLKAASH